MEISAKRAPLQNRKQSQGNPCTSKAFAFIIMDLSKIDVQMSCSVVTRV